MDVLEELYLSSKDSLEIRSINLNNMVLRRFKDRILVDVYEENFKANRMQLAIENKDIDKLIKFLKNG